MAKKKNKNISVAYVGNAFPKRIDRVRFCTKNCWGCDLFDLHGRTNNKMY